MKGPELGVHADDIEAPHVEQEPKQDVLENQNVTQRIPSLSHRAVNAHAMLWCGLTHTRQPVSIFSLSGCCSESPHRWPGENQGRLLDLWNCWSLPSQKPNRREHPLCINVFQTFYPATWCNMSWFGRPLLFQVMKRSHEARQRLLRLGIFRKVEVVIDTSQGAVYCHPLDVLITMYFVTWSC